MYNDFKRQDYYKYKWFTRTSFKRIIILFLELDEF